MKFHKLTLCNLNSLAGEQTLDFDAVTQGAGMFLIHGPTGAGKSTILDAICLALFGKTPRLGDTGNVTLEGRNEGASDESAARVMTQGTGYCSAELELSVADEQGTRTRYRATWAVQRAHKRPGERFQKPRRRLEIFGEGAWHELVSSDQRRHFEEPFERMLRGLNFTDFQRTILLAQFKFREFLEADGKARTAILERMTDSERFRQIGKRVAGEKRRADEALRECKAGLESLALLSDEERVLLEARLAASRAEAAKVREGLGHLETARAYVASLAQVQQRVDEAQSRLAEVAERREVVAEALFALAEDERVAGARHALAALRAASESAAGHQARLAETRRDEEAARATEQTARDTHEGAQVARLAAAAARAQELPAIEAAAEAWRRARAAQDAAARAAAVLTEAAQALAARRTTRDELALALDGARGALATCAQGLAEIPAAARIAEGAGGVADRWLQAQKSGDAAARAADAREGERERGVQHAAGREAHAERLAEATQAAGEASATLRAVEHEIAALTSGAGLEAALAHEEVLRDEAEGALGALGAFERALAQTAQARDALAAAQGQTQEAAQQVAEAEREESRQAELLAPCAAALEEARAHLRTIEALLAVLDHRDVLREGEPCPVCGSAEHPFVQHPERAPRLEEERARRADIAARVDAAQVAFRAADEGHRAAALARASATARLAEREREAATRREAAEAAAGACAALARAAGADPGAPAGWDGWCAAQRAGAEGRRQAAQQRYAELRGLESRLRAARDAAEGAARAQGDAERALERHDEAGKLSAARLLDLEAQARARAEEASADRARLEERLRELSVDTDDLEAGVRQIAERVEQVRALGEARAAADAKLRALEPELAAADASFGEAEAAWARAGVESEAAARSEAEALAAARATLGGADPDARLAALDAALAQGTQAESAAKDALAAAQSALARATTLREEHARAAAEAAARVGEAEAALEGALGEVGLARAADVEARTLSAEARGEAAALRDALAREEHEARTLLAAAVSERAALRASPPAGEWPAEDAVALAARLDALREARVTAEAALEAAQRDLGACEQSLGDDDRARAEAAGRREALAAAQADLDHWKVLHELVGESEGERFAAVVQALHLQQVLVHANEHLARFMARYALEQVIHQDAGPILDFRVVDQQQQGASRSIRSLSGGESFIVSLALALGLSAMRSSRVRIETLLIDEGFGSLDPAALAVAQQALQSLQGVLGVQIGLISHVATLKEDIGAQVYVEPVGAGRSRIRVRSTSA